MAPSELHSSIREALISIAPAFSWKYGLISDEWQIDAKFVPNGNQSMLLAMLAQNVESKLQIVQNVTSVFLTTCFPDHFVPARYLLLILAGERSSLREVIISYLYGATKMDHINYSFLCSIDHVNKKDTNEVVVDVNQLSSEQRKVTLPNFKAMVNYVHEQIERRQKNSSQKHVYGKIQLVYSYEVYTEILDYLRLCLWFSAGAQDAPGTVKAAHHMRNYVNSNYADDESNEIRKYINMVKDILFAKRGKIELSCLYDLLDASPNVLAMKCVDLIDGFELGLKDVSDHTRILVAQLQGILLANGTNENDFNQRVSYYNCKQTI